MVLKQYKQTLIVFVLCSFILLFFYLIVPDILSARQQELSLKQQRKQLKTLTTRAPTLAEKLKKILKCHDRELIPERFQYGDYYLIRNLFVGEKSKKVTCAETITYTTNGDYTFVDSLPIVVKSWLAPISFTLYTPGFDLNNTMASIQYLRNCLNESSLIRDYVSFHIFFPNNHMPKYVPLNELEAEFWTYNCTEPAPYLNVNRSELYKTQANLTYPINVARNIARKAANTHFIFPCDIELIPSPGIATKFLDMIAKNTSVLYGNNGLRVFPLPVFEIRSDAQIPNNKTKLKAMLKKRTAIPFHAMICKNCHLVPNQTQWMNTTDSDHFSITAIGKREGYFRYWEPFYISDNREPIFDERVTWEGQSNKRIQNFAMCLLGYEYLILHPAFLTHMPGIKRLDRQRIAYAPAMNRIIKKTIEPEYRILYGNSKNCYT